MFIGLEETITKFQRTSKLGNSHEYYRKMIMAIFRCDGCNSIFKRQKGKMDAKRLSNNYFHCCSNCDVKRFAQQKGAERKKIWDIPASSLKPIGKI